MWSPSLHKLNDTVDLHNLTYVDDNPCSKELECGICHSPLVDPPWTQCDHWFCKTCLHQSFDAVDERRRASFATAEARTGHLYSCPTCRKWIQRDPRFARAGVPRQVTNMLSELQVYVHNVSTVSAEQTKSPTHHAQLAYCCCC